MENLIMFYAPWCPVCSQMTSVFDLVLPGYPSLPYTRLNVDDQVSADMLIKCRVRTIPTFIILNEDAIVDRVEGAFTVEQAQNWLDDVLGITLEKERRGELPLRK